MIRTKILATLGPGTQDDAVLGRLLEAGVQAVRLNFSHGSLDEHAAMLGRVRQMARDQGRAVAVLGDLRGPKIRLGQIDPTDDTDGMPIEIGQSLVIQREPITGRDGRVSLNRAELVDDVAVGQRILIEDGLLRFLVTDRTDEEVICTCTAGGVIQSRKGVNFPDTDLRLPAMTDYDRQCVDWAMEHELDYLALSFVRRADDLLDLRRRLGEADSGILIVPKIEKPEALDQIDAILDAADALMVARGDLGVEMDLARVPIIQKQLIRRCQVRGKPVIVATQMLQSMIDQTSPTRAEVSDVANAIFDGTDVVMLSGETAVGRHPLAAVQTMAHVAAVTEDDLLQRHADDLDHMPRIAVEPLYAAIARGAWQMVRALKIKLVIVRSETGHMARIFSKSRFPVPIIAVSSRPRVVRQMALLYGVEPMRVDTIDALGESCPLIDRTLIDRELVQPGDPVLIVGGASADQPETANGIAIHRIGSHDAMPAVKQT